MATSPNSPDMLARAAKVAEHLAAALKAAEEYREAGNASLCDSEYTIADLIDVWRDAAVGIV